MKGRRYFIPRSFVHPQGFGPVHDVSRRGKDRFEPSFQAGDMEPPEEAPMDLAELYKRYLYCVKFDIIEKGQPQRPLKAASRSSARKWKGFFPRS